MARGFGLTYAGLILAASIITSLTIGRVEVATPLLVAVAVALGIRSLMVGIRIRGSELVIVSWFRTYRFPRERIQDAVIDDYSGWFTNFAPSRRIRILELEIDGRDREFSCTAMTRRAAIAVRAEVARTIGLEVGDVNEERHPMPVLGRWGNG